MPSTTDKVWSPDVPTGWGPGFWPLICIKEPPPIRMLATLVLLKGTSRYLVGSSFTVKRLVQVRVQYVHGKRTALRLGEKEYVQFKRSGPAVRIITCQRYALTKMAETKPSHDSPGDHDLRSWVTEDRGAGWWGSRSGYIFFKWRYFRNEYSASVSVPTWAIENCIDTHAPFLM